MEQDGFSVAVAYGGASGLHLLDENKDNCSLVILDVMMPDMDGFHVLQKNQRSKQCPHAYAYRKKRRE